MSDVDATQAEAALEAFDARLDELEDQLDVDFTAEQREAIFAASSADGLTRQATDNAAAWVAADILGVDLSDEADLSAPADVMASADDPTDEEVDAFKADVILTHGADLERLERDLGRPLLRGERKAITKKVAEYGGRFGDLPDQDFAMDALRQYHDGDLPDKSTTQGRTWLASQKLREAEEPDPEDDPSLDELDLDKPEDMMRYRVAKLKGVEFEYEDHDNGDAPDTDSQEAA